VGPDPNLIRINTQLARARSDLRGYIKIGASSPDQAAELKHIDADLTRVINAIGQRLRGADSRPPKATPLEYDERD
jgi:hypothetical protein